MTPPTDSPRSAAPGGRGPGAAHPSNGRPTPASRPSSDGFDPARHLKAAGRNLAEVVTYAQQLVGAKVSQVAYGVRKLALLAMLGAVAGIAGVSVLVTSAVILVTGLARGLGRAFPEGWDWLGPVIVGLLGLGIAFGIVYLVIRRAAWVGKRMAVEQYRLALQQQRKAYGHDAFSRSAAAAAEQDLEVRRMRTRTAEEVEKFREQREQAEKAQRQMEQDFARLKNN